MIKDKALTYFNNGYSCSESIVKAAIDEGLCPKDLLPCATTFSAGMSSGCACGTITGAQLVLGYLFGSAKKEHCSKFVEDVSDILESLVKVTV